jgi:hypothetical protein
VALVRCVQPQALRVLLLVWQPSVQLRVLLLSLACLPLVRAPCWQVPAVGQQAWLLLAWQQPPSWLQQEVVWQLPCWCCCWRSRLQLPSCCLLLLLLLPLLAWLRRQLVLPALLLLLLAPALRPAWPAAAAVLRMLAAATAWLRQRLPPGQTGDMPFV